MPSSFEDMNWLPAARAGDSEALGAALEACRASLEALAAGLVGAGPRLAEAPGDIVQSDFARALASFFQFRGQTWPEWSGWLRQIVGNTYRDALRRRRGPREVPLDDLVSGSDASAPALFAQGPSPSSAEGRRELVRLVQESLPKLTPARRTVFLMHVFDGLAFTQIAMILERTPDAIRMRYNHACDDLKRLLGITDGTR